MTNYRIIIDTTGLKCPLPVLKVRKDLKALEKDDVALIIADDPLAEIDLRHFCTLKGYTICSVSKKYKDEKQYYEIRY